MNEKIADSFDKAMKKGFLSTLILLILKEKPTHGYGIIKKIKKRSLDVLTPPASSIYTVLNTLYTKGLISCDDEDTEVKSKKVYSISRKGEKILEIMLEKYEALDNAMKSIIASVFDLNNQEISESSKLMHLPSDILFKSLDKLTDIEKKERLLNLRELITDSIENHKKRLKKIDESLNKF